MLWFVLGSVGVLEVWRRAVAHKAPSWLPRLMVAVYAAIAGGVVYTWLGLRNAFGAVADVNPADKASSLAAGISHAMYGTAVSLVCAIVGAGLLAWVSARRAPLPRAVVRE